MPLNKNTEKIFYSEMLKREKKVNETILKMLNLKVGKK
jgi:hypothetical protein